MSGIELENVRDDLYKYVLLLILYADDTVIFGIIDATEFQKKKKKTIKDVFCDYAKICQLDINSDNGTRNDDRFQFRIGNSII